MRLLRSSTVIEGIIIRAIITTHEQRMGQTYEHFTYEHFTIP